MTEIRRMLTLDEFKARIEQIGGGVPEERLAPLHEAYRDLMGLAGRLRRGLGYADEPASVFPPEGER